MSAIFGLTPGLTAADVLIAEKPVELHYITIKLNGMTAKNPARMGLTVNRRFMLNFTAADVFDGRVRELPCRISVGKGDSLRFFFEGKKTWRKCPPSITLFDVLGTYESTNEMHSMPPDPR